MAIKNSVLSNKLAYFIISPILGLLSALRSPNSRSSYTIYSLFIVFFGFSLYFDGSVRYDGLLIAYDFQEWSKLGFNDYLNHITSVFSIESLFSEKDIFELTVLFLTSRITTNYHIFFMVVALFYAFFMPRVLKYFTSLDRKKYNYSFYVLFYLFIPAHLYSIAGVRFGLATWVFLYSLFKIIIDGRNKYHILMFITPLIHVSFIFAIVVYLIYRLLFGRYKVWFVLLVLSFVFSELSVTLLKNRIDSFTGGGGWINWLDAYANFNEYQEAEKGTGFYWVVPIFSFLKRAFLLIILLVVYKNKSLIDASKTSKRVFCFALACYTLSNFCMSIPHLGSRFISLCYPTLTYLWLKHSLDKHYKFLLYSFPFVFLLSLKQTLDVYINSLDYTFLFSPIVNVIKYLFFNVPITPNDINHFIF